MTTIGKRLEVKPVDGATFWCGLYRVDGAGNQTLIVTFPPEYRAATERWLSGLNQFGVR